MKPTHSFTFTLVLTAVLFALALLSGCVSHDLIRQESLTPSSRDYADTPAAPVYAPTTGVPIVGPYNGRIVPGISVNGINALNPLLH